MKKRVYDYYREELDYLRVHGHQFSKAHPEIASLLDFGATPDEDPFVRRLVEAFAFLTSRVRLKLDDDFPRISEAMLEQLLPFVLRPTPAFSVAQFRLPPENADVTEAQILERGEVFELKTQKHIKFSTASRVECWPVTISDAQFKCVPFEPPAALKSSMPQSRLEMTISGQSGQTNIHDLDIEELVFFVQNDLFGFPIHELIVNTSRNFAGLVLEGGPNDEPILLSVDDIEVVGLDESHALLPYNQQGFFGHQLLAEFLAFPQKFLFFKIKLNSAFRQFKSNNFKIGLYFRDTHVDLERIIDKSTFKLGCCPVVNLFDSPVDAEIELDHFRSHYEVVPDKTQATRFEVYSVKEVRAHGAKGKPQEFEPFYTRSDRSSRSTDNKFWHIERNEWPGDRINGSKTTLSFVDTEFKKADLENFKTVRLGTTCMNRELFNLRKARTIYEINDEIPLESFEGSGVFGQGTFVLPFTEAILAPMNSQLFMSLISHLNSSLTSFGNDTALPALKNILDDLDFVKFERNRELVSLITDLHVLSCVETVKNIQDVDTCNDPADSGNENLSPSDYFGRNSIAVCRGTKFVIQLDKGKIEDKAWYQFMCVLDRFFVNNSNVNSFTKLEVRSNLDNEILAEFDAKCGRRRLI